MMHDLRTVLIQNEEKKETRVKTVRNPKVDMGVSKVQDDKDDNKYGATMDPKNFKGNVDLQIHLNMGIHNLMKKKQYEKSMSMYAKKFKKRIAIDDYNIKMPDEEIKNRGRFETEEGDEGRE
jgi:hypothetical protein